MKKLFSVKKELFMIPLAAAGMLAAVRYSGECYKGIENGISFCAEVLVPSLFIFMALTANIIYSGASGVISLPFGFLGKIMRLPREAVPAVVLSAIGGYPIGAACVRSMYEKGTLSESEAAKTAYIAVAAGPGFLISYVGKALSGSAYVGNILLVSQIIALIMNGIIVGCCLSAEPPLRRSPATLSCDNAFVRAVDSAMNSTFSMCSMVIIFSAVIEVVSTLTHGEATDILSAALEITTGCSRLCGRAPLFIIAFFIGFGGLSVHFQIFAALKDIKLNKMLFIIFRLSEGIICAGAAYILLMILPIDTEVFSSTAEPLTTAGRAAVSGSAALILASVCFVGSINNRIRRIRPCAE